jgi:hypothetical protein
MKRKLAGLLIICLLLSGCGILQLAEEAVSYDPEDAPEDGSATVTEENEAAETTVDTVLSKIQDVVGSVESLATADEGQENGACTITNFSAEGPSLYMTLDYPGADLRSSDPSWDGWLSVSFSQAGTDSVSGYMNASGEITLTPPGVYYNADTSAIYAGTTEPTWTGSDDGEYKILCCDENNIFMVEKNTANIDERRKYICFIDAYGNELCEPLDITELDIYNLTGYALGSGMFGFDYEESYSPQTYIMNSQTGTYFTLPYYLSDECKYVGDTMITEFTTTNSDGVFIGALASIDTEGNITELPFDFDPLDTLSLDEVGANYLLFRDETKTYSYQYDGGGSLSREASYLYCYDYSGNLLWAYLDYPSYQSVNIGDYELLWVTGADAKTYIICLDMATGKPTTEPVYMAKSSTGWQLIKDSHEVYGRYLLDNDGTGTSVVTDLVTGEAYTLSLPNYILAYIDAAVFAFMNDDDRTFVVLDLVTGEELCRLSLPGCIFAYGGNGLFAFYKDGEYSFYSFSGELITPYLQE